MMLATSGWRGTISHLNSGGALHTFISNRRRRRNERRSTHATSPPSFMSSASGVISRPNSSLALRKLNAQSRHAMSMKSDWFAKLYPAQILHSH